MNLGPLKEQAVFLIMEPSLSVLQFVFLLKFNFLAESFQILACEVAVSNTLALCLWFLVHGLGNPVELDPARQD